MKINPAYSSEVSLEITQIIQNINSIWKEKLKDTIALNLNFRFSDSWPTGMLGGSKPAILGLEGKVQRQKPS